MSFFYIMIKIVHTVYAWSVNSLFHLSCEPLLLLQSCYMHICWTRKTGWYVKICVVLFPDWIQILSFNRYLIIHACLENTISNHFKVFGCNMAKCDRIQGGMETFGRHYTCRPLPYPRKKLKQSLIFIINRQKVNPDLMIWPFNVSHEGFY